MRRLVQKHSPPRQHASRASRTSSPVTRPNPIQRLHQTFGNQIVTRMLHGPVQRSQSGFSGAAQQSDGILEVAQRVISGNGIRLPHLDKIQRSFGRHDVSGIRAHLGPEATAASHSIGASAYATGESVAFDRTPDLYTAAHEAAHVVQQRAGVDVTGGVGQPGDIYEQHADTVAAQVVQGRSAEHLLDQHSTNSDGGRSVQRFAFINESQIKKSEKDFTATMKKWVSDTTIRNYTDVDEFKKHSEKQTDYLGNLKDGTWMRFNKTGLNLLGEEHTKVTLEDVVPAVGSKSFIHEQLAADILTAGSELRKTYERENKALFKQLGIEKDKKKEEFGSESLFPKIGFALTIAIPYFEGKEAMTDLDKTGYVGKPVQRYLKIAWAFSKDNKQTVQQKQKAKEKVSPKLEALATVHTSVEAKLDKFITSLPVDGFIGDELTKKKNASLLPPLAEFTKAVTDAAVEMATTEKSSRLTDAERKKLSGAKSISEAEKTKLFSDWRDFMFEDNVKAAAARGVRYAGMGQAHLDHLVGLGLPKDHHAFEMAGKDLTAFQDLTEKLKKAAKK